LSSLEPLRSKLSRRNRRKFEQKAAKETKTDWVSVLFIRQGLRGLSGSAIVVVLA
jgi:hypothetical protein